MGIEIVCRLAKIFLYASLIMLTVSGCAGVLPRVGGNVNLTIELLVVKTGVSGEELVRMNSAQEQDCEVVSLSKIVK